MSPVEGFLRHAVECKRMAGWAGDPQSRAVWIGMASGGRENRSSTSDLNTKSITCIESPTDDGPKGGIAITLDAELPSASARAQFYRTNSCAQCGQKLQVPNLMEVLSDRIVRYLWSCEACGHQFETSVYLAPEWHCYT